MPFTASGEQLNPNSGSTKRRRASSSRNHDAQADSTGRPNRTERRCRTNSAPSSNKTVLRASPFAPNVVSNNSLESSTTWRTGRFLPGIWNDDRYTTGFSPREPMNSTCPTAIWKRSPSSAAAIVAPMSWSPPKAEIR